MKKTLGIVSLLAVLNASATITVNWVATWGIDDPSVPGSTADLGSGGLAQLIWSPDGAMSAIDNANPLVPTGGEIVLRTISTWDNVNNFVGGYIAVGTSGNTYADGSGVLAAVSEAQLLAGSVYTRVFSSGTPTTGTWWGQGGLDNTLADQDPTPSPFDESNIAPGSTYTLQYQITAIPEPSTLAIAGIGALLAGIRILRRK